MADTVTGHDALIKPANFASMLSSSAVHAHQETLTALQDQNGAIADAMRYAVQGGKGFRAFLVMETARLHDVHPDVAGYAASAIECLHAYSLIHDDMPCMDDDDMRRGQPTVHRKWNEATAVLAGDALQALAFAQVAQAGQTDSAKLSMIQSFADAAGIAGMVGGQARDMAAETADQPLTLDDITRLQAGKTGALITWSALAGPRMACAPLDALRRYGDAIGLAFQIADDILDVEGNADTVGKAVRKDMQAGKATFVSLLGLDAAKSRARELVQDACDALIVYGAKANVLQEAAHFIISRDK
jgi:farnesyl diphosphate synthase